MTYFGDLSSCFWRYQCLSLAVNTAPYGGFLWCVACVDLVREAWHTFHSPCCAMDPIWSVVFCYGPNLFCCFSAMDPICSVVFCYGPYLFCCFLLWTLSVLLFSAMDPIWSVVFCFGPYLFCCFLLWTLSDLLFSAMDPICSVVFCYGPYLFCCFLLWTLSVLTLSEKPRSFLWPRLIQTMDGVNVTPIRMLNRLVC